MEFDSAPRVSLSPGIVGRLVLPGANAVQGPTPPSTRGGQPRDWDPWDVIELLVAHGCWIFVGLGTYACAYLTAIDIPPMTHFAWLFAFEAVPSIALAVIYCFWRPEREGIMLYALFYVMLLLIPYISAIVKVVSDDSRIFVAHIFIIVALVFFNSFFCYKLHRRSR